MTCHVSKKAAKISIWIALVLLIFSLVMIVMFPTIYNAILKKSIALTEGSLITNHAWKDIPLPIYEKLYFFNITNMDNFLEGSEPMNVSEVGPYTYKGRWIKDDFIMWNPNNTVSYQETRTYHFVPEMSIGPQEDEIYTLNGPLIIAAGIAENYGEDERAILSVILGMYGEEIVIKRKIKELVYDGYEDFIIKYAKFIKDIPYQNGIFSWLYGKNATNDGIFTVHTGGDDVSKINFLDRWNGEEKLNFWNGSTCNMLKGTSGETGPPIQDTRESYSFFQSIFCRTLAFNYSGDVEHFDVKAKRFKSTYSLFANSTENPDNYCYEVHRQRPSGILDVSPCQFGAPIFISFPHFLFSDPSYFDAVSGLSPNETEHGSYIDVEPQTGLSIGIVIRFQINVELTKVTGIFQTYSPWKGVLPVFWAEINVLVTEDLADFLKSQTKTPKIASYSVLGGLMVICATITVVCFFILCSQNDDDVPLLDAVKDEYSQYCDNKALSSSGNCERDVAKNNQEKFTGSSEFKKENVSRDKSDESLVKI